MANVLDLRRRIRSVKNTRQITKAMKMVSAAKLRRAQERALSARPYAKMITSVLESLTRRVDIFDERTGNLRHPLFVTRPEKRVLLIVISGDKGFAGAFNANILKTAFQFINGNPDKEIDVEAVGRKGRDLMRRRYPAAVYTEQTDANGHTHPGERPQGSSRSYRRPSGNVVEAGTEPRLRAGAEHHLPLRARRDRRGLHRLQRIQVGDPAAAGGGEAVAADEDWHSADRRAQWSLRKKSKSAPPKPHSRAGIEIEPVDTAEADEEAKKFGTARWTTSTSSRRKNCLHGLLPQYVSSMLYHAMTESVAAEHAARMTAMDSATNNASDMIDALTLHMNRVRQAAITKEIIEIVSGAAAL